MEWQVIIKEIGLIGIISTLITLLINELCKFYIGKRFKAYELELTDKYKDIDRQLSILIESHKKSLELLYFKDSKLHEKRIEVIAELYEKLVLLQFAMNDMTSLLKTVTLDAEKNNQIENAKIENSSKAYDDFYIFYSKHRIYFSSQTCQLVNKIKDEFYDSYFDYTHGKEYESENYEYFFKLAKHASDKVRKEIPMILDNIENEFRNIIGVKID